LGDLRWKKTIKRSDRESFPGPDFIKDLQTINPEAMAPGFLLPQILYLMIITLALAQWATLLLTLPSSNSEMPLNPRLPMSTRK